MMTQFALLGRELCHGSDNLGDKDMCSYVPSASQENVAPQMPVKKQTRQWAAWTRQEEERFFAALRQVGKNFEQITSRVQSKNKDQVRHYYYRLVRRMNKLLGPELSLDAKNSKDTNAAMLRWWSLLEKYSFKASKLHLKPRRYKIFVEALENQLLKDRKKNIKKRPSAGENNSPIPSIPASNQVRSSDHDTRAVKMVLVDSQNIPKVGTGKGALVKRNINMETNHTTRKVDPALFKATKHRRKTGLVSITAYKRWEQAAIAGVSLVADAAEHLEKVDTDKESENFQETPCHDGSQLVGEVARPLEMSPQIKFNESTIHNTTKLKLQLFPIDECTRKALETDNHNPHLELTLSTRKKISSVLEHLNHKWCTSSLPNKELMLFPYWAQKENLVGYQRWTKDSTLCAADVHYHIGSPLIFRLRYGWFSRTELESATAHVLSHTNVRGLYSDIINTSTEENAEAGNLSSPHNSQPVSAEQTIHLTPSSTIATPIKTAECGVSVSNINASNYHGSMADVSSLRKSSGDLAVMGQVEYTKDVSLSAGEWADSLTNISVGELLSEPTHNCTEFPVPITSDYLQPNPNTCDSFDAAIAAHIFKHQNRVDTQQGLGSHLAPSSIWDAEETCDSFSFQKSSAFYNKDPNRFMGSSLSVCEEANITSPASCDEVEELLGVEKLPDGEDLVDDYGANRPLENSTKEFGGGLTDMYWPDSLGPLDLDIPPACGYHSNDLILSDNNSLGGLIANGVDAFQSCSFGDVDKKECSEANGQDNSPFSGLKDGGEL